MCVCLIYTHSIKFPRIFSAYWDKPSPSPLLADQKSSHGTWSMGCSTSITAGAVLLKKSLCIQSCPYNDTQWLYIHKYMYIHMYKITLYSNDIPIKRISNIYEHPHDIQSIKIKLWLVLSLYIYMIILTIPMIFSLYIYIYLYTYIYFICPLYIPIISPRVSDHLRWGPWPLPAESLAPPTKNFQRP